MISTHLPFRLDDGLSEGEAREARRLLGEGLLTRVLGDVVVAADAVPGLDLRAYALRLILSGRLAGAGAVVAQEAAAWLWASSPTPRYIDVVVTPGRVRSPCPYVLVHERRLSRGDVVEVTARDGSGLPVTCPARTAADLLRCLPEPAALDEAVSLAHRTGVAPSEISACLGTMPRARGVARARRLVARWPGPLTPCACP
jgi:hypothetical protein